MPPGVTWPGLLLALTAQTLAVAGISLAYGLSRRAMARLARSVLVADVIVALLLALVAAVFLHLNRGPHHRRALVMLTHLFLAAVIPWLVWELAVSTAVGRRAGWSGGILMVLTAGALTLPGVRLSKWRQEAVVTRCIVHLPALPEGLDGAKIVLVSDTHIGPRIPVAQARARLRPLPELEADLVVFAGDLSSGGTSGIIAGAALIDEMAPAGNRFAVLGNHDHWTDERLVRDELEKHGFTTLVNRSIRTRLRGVDVWLAGVNDPYTGADDITRALQGVPRDAFLLLLSHGPDIVRERLAQSADLILAGHTHGGQVVLPMVGPVACGSIYGPRYAAGLFEVGHTKLFVTRGLGEVVVPLRVFCPPEIAVLELRTSRAQQRG